MLLCLYTVVCISMQLLCVHLGSGKGRKMWGGGGGGEVNVVEKGRVCTELRE